MESGQSMPFGVRKFWALSWCQYLPAGWTWASSLTFTSTDFLIHNLEITVGKSWSSTIIMVFYIITQLRKACFWKSASGLFFFWLPLAFLAQDLFQHHVYLLLGEESPGGILSWKWAMDKQKKKKILYLTFLDQRFCKMWVPRGGNTLMPPTGLLSQKQRTWDGTPRNHGHLSHEQPQLFVMGYWSYCRGRGANCAVTGKINTKQKSSRVWRTGYTIDLGRDITALGPVVLRRSRRNDNS